ncbi:TadE/TadG family type IV pilus assembly protein [Aminobacter ciceronei]|uniref:Flp pilus assembly protein TadG n=1 Tax=Aminobacter ciceronei TaxID=150723 RepID=A0ABR6CFZ4_9HYPH|nr:TadE/TadG family type IV pilus assembly protein [Aminobacter ciceronei]MBA8910205.1 Flp pilus assembly protein TadG [Aminobacter ciceronei]MBA9023971.1 Flp pilus assembly protein TadG [Aminobacter ciceronei]
MNPIVNLRDFLSDEQGVAMTEAIIVVPFLTFLAISVLEFGSVLWQREQIATGMRDAARYMARCRHSADTCQNVARNLAYYGSAAVTTRLRVRDWNADNSPITFTESVSGSSTIISATTTHQLPGSPLFSALGIGNITVNANHNQRKIGW